MSDDLATRMNRPIDPDETLAPDMAQDMGVLSEVNRRLLHKRGLALGVKRTDDGRSSYVMLQTDDPQGIWFNPERHPHEELRAKRAAFDHLLLPARRRALGYMVQPIDDEWTVRALRVASERVAVAIAQEFKVTADPELPNDDDPLAERDFFVELDQVDHGPGGQVLGSRPRKYRIVLEPVD